MSDLFDGRLEAFQIVKEDHCWAPENQATLYYGDECIWVWGDDEGFVKLMKADDTEGYIISAICKAFEVDIVSQYEPEFWILDLVDCINHL
jgi:hypothetical protein